MLRGPNKINFGNVFDNIGAKIVDNLPVLITVIGIILLYFPLLIYYRRKDKKDALRVSTIYYLLLALIFIAWCNNLMYYKVNAYIVLIFIN